MSEERKIINTNIRFNLDNPQHRRAYELLQRIDRRKYKSYTEAVVYAVNSCFGRLEQLAADPYLETREKEDAFLQKVLDTIQSGMEKVSQPLALGNLLSLLQANTPQQVPVTNPVEEAEDEEFDEESLEAALAFADSF